MHKSRTKRRPTTKSKAPKTVHARELSSLAMVARNEKKYSRVINGDNLMQWVAIGWITERKATPTDRKNYPEVVYG